MEETSDEIRWKLVKYLIDEFPTLRLKTKEYLDNQISLPRCFGLIDNFCSKWCVVYDQCLLEKNKTPVTSEQPLPKKMNEIVACSWCHNTNKAKMQIFPSGNVFCFQCSRWFKR